MRMRVSKTTPDSLNAVLRANEQGLVRTSSPKDVMAANGLFTVSHDLGAVPDGFGYSPYGNVTVWATRNNRKAWSSDTLVLTGSAAIEVQVWATVRL